MPIRFGVTTLISAWAPALSLISAFIESVEMSTATKRKIICKYYYKIMKANSLEETLILEKMEDRRRRGQQRMRLLDSFTNSADMSLSKLQGIVKDREV